METVPKMISTKDLSYLEDLFSWSFTSVKVAKHFSKEVKDQEIQDAILQFEGIQKNICLTVLNILKGEFHEPNNQ